MISIIAQPSEARASLPPPTPNSQPTTQTAAQPVAAPGPDKPAAQPAVRQVTVELPEIPAGKLSLSVDDETGRVIGRVLDRNTGDLLFQVPSADMLRLIASTEKLLGPLYSAEA